MPLTVTQFCMQDNTLLSCVDDDDENMPAKIEFLFAGGVILKNEAFYNRTREAARMVEIINKMPLNNKIIIIAGRTGIGKSAFVDKVLRNELRNRLSIRVNICKVSGDTIDNLYYINTLYRTIVNLANQKLFDNIHSPLQQGMSSLKNLLSFGFDVLLDKTVGEGNTLYEPANERSVLRKKDYIISVLRKNAFIVTIDNIQNIDAQSMEILNDILNHITNSTFIFEYTTSGENTSDELLAFYNALKKYNATVYLFEMKRLGYNEAKKLAPPSLTEIQIQELYQRSNGNLIKIQLADNSMSLDDDPIAVRLAHLSKDKRFVVNLLYLNESPVRYADLCRMLIGNLNAPPFSEQTIYQYINELEREKIVRILGSGEIRIYHDSIIAQLDVQAASVLLYSAYTILKEYYCRKLCEPQNEEAVEHLFCLYVRFSDEELLTIFPQIVKVIRSYKYPNTAINKLISFRERIQLQGHLNPQLYVKLVTLLVNLCLEYGLWEEALSNLNLIYSPTNPYHRAMKAAALSLDFTNDESISSIHYLIQQATSPREKLTSELCLLSAKMARQPRKESIKMAQRMMATSEYHDCLEFAFLLSNYAELIDNTTECISLYKQAIERFHSVGRDELGANILVFLSMLYAYEGRIVEARKVLDMGKTLGEIKESYLLNNYSVLNILEGKMTTDDAKQFSDALLLTCDPYERILIQCNLLVCYTLLSEKERAEQIMLEITSQQFEQFQYEEFLHIVYQDLLFYFKADKQCSQVDKYRQLLQELIENAPSDSMFVPIAKMQLTNQSSPNLYYSQFPFRVDFLGCWNIEISSDLENY